MKRVQNHPAEFFPYAYFEGEIIPTTDAKVSIMTNALQYGTGVFGGIRGYYNQDKNFLSIFRLEDHLKRFISSLKILGVTTPYSTEELKQIILELVEKNKPDRDVYFRPFCYASSLNLSPNLNRDTVFEFALYMIPLGEYLSVNKGLNVCVSSWIRIQDNAIPARAKISGAYINSALARKEAADRGFDEAIFITGDGHVAEGSAENIFIVRDGGLITPESSDEVLEGITRNTIIDLAQDLGIPVKERSVDRSELYISDEAFFCGTGVQVAWIGKIDGRTIGNGIRGPVTAKLQELFFNIVHGNESKYGDWCTVVKPTNQ